jgi:hypothetical protein
MRESGVAFDAAEFSDQDLRTVFNRAMRSVAIASVIGVPILWTAWGWRSMLLFLVGAIVAGTGILEWRQLMGAVLGRLATEGQTTPRPIRGVLFWFFLRFAAAAGLLYVSLKGLDGKVLALILGLALALIALMIEALRLLRAWTV